MVTTYKKDTYVYRDLIRVIADGESTSGANQGKIASGAGATTLYYELDPEKRTSIIVTHNTADTATISLTNHFDSSEDLEDAGVVWAQVYSDTAGLYHAGAEHGHCGVKININPATGDCLISIIQIKK